MKLIYITNVRIPTEKAHGYQICKMCEEFSNQGVEIELWVPTRKNQIKKDVFSFYGIESNFKIEKIKSFDFFSLERYLGKFSFWLQNFWFVIKIFLIKTDKDSIIYTRDPEMGWIFNLKGNKTILESHNWPEKKSRLFKCLIKKFNKIVVITYELKKLLVKAGWPESRIMVAPDGVDLKKFDINLDKEQARKQLNLPQNKKIIMYSGHLYEWKGAEDLARAATFLKADNLIVFVGGVENDVNSFRGKNRNLIANNKIVIIGHQAHSLIPLWLKAADLLVLPNRSREKISKYYTSPLKLFEYMASRRPIVAANLPSIMEVMNEKNCVFFDSDNPEDLANKIKLVFSDNSLAENISEQAYQDVKNYTWEKRAEKILNFICEK